jgi:hypothetical protein
LVEEASFPKEELDKEQTMRKKTLKHLLTLAALGLILCSPATVALAQDGGGELDVGAVVFEDGFEDWRDANQRVENDWNTWSLNDCALETAEGDRDALCGSPEYKQANPVNAYPERTHSGQNAQQYHTVHQSHHGGVWRRFEVEPGTVIEVHAWGTAWSTQGDDAHAYDPSQNVRMRIGVDPNGGSNPSGAAVAWGDPANPPNKWQEIPPVTVTAGGTGRVSVFLSSNPHYPLKHNDIYWDDVYALKVGTAPNLPDGNAGEDGNGDGGGVQAAAAQAEPPPDPVLEGMVEGEDVTTYPGRGGDARWLWVPAFGLTVGAYIFYVTIAQRDRERASLLPVHSHDRDTTRSNSDKETIR